MKRQYRIVKYSDHHFEIERKLLFGWRYCGGGDTPHLYETLEEAKHVVDNWGNPNWPEVVYLKVRP